MINGKLLYPVGSIYMSINSKNPSELFGGTWERIAKGKTLVGVDESDTDFNTSQKTGGEKTHTLTINEMPSHTHQYLLSYGGNDPASGFNYGNTLAGTFDAHFSKATGGGQAHNNMPPYLVVYMWKRVS